MNRSDVLVIGAGIGGLSTAIRCAERGLSVVVVTKSADLHESNTWYAQGGIVESGEGDSPALLQADILAAGDNLNSRPAVSMLAAEGPRLVDEYLIEKAGVPFVEDADGRLDRTQEAAHSVRRILHVRDTTGRSIQERLLALARSLPAIRLVAGHCAVDIITNTHNSTDSQQRYHKTRALGAYILEESSGDIQPWFANAVVLASGGIGNLYLHTSNPPGATGDGIAMAYRAGCEIINAEYVQFHPTVLFHRDVKRFLISEAVRGEGARLRNRAGEYFMQRYHPDLLDLAPRDEVARAIYQEMESDGAGYVFLDTPAVRGVDLEQRFPLIFGQCRSLGIDIAAEPIPVVPAAHYHCGGIKVDLHGRTEIKRLFAVGETACTGVHGANRLASVSLLEGLVYGIRIGDYIASKTKTPKPGLFESIPEWVYPKQEEEFDSVLIHQDLVHIQSTMWNYVGIIRTRKRLYRALSDLNYLSHRIERFYQQARASREMLELRNAVLTGSIIAGAAFSNHRSLGCHFVSE